MELVG
jgi:hypothetical protein